MQMFTTQYDSSGGDILSGITAILPAYNEEISIGSVVLCTRKYADRVIVVDDGSHDRTAEVAKLAGTEVIRHPYNTGKGAALGRDSDIRRTPGRSHFGPGHLNNMNYN